MTSKQAGLFTTIAKGTAKANPLGALGKFITTKTQNHIFNKIDGVTKAIIKTEKTLNNSDRAMGVLLRRLRKGYRVRRRGNLLNAKDMAYGAGKVYQSNRTNLAKAQSDFIKSLNRLKSLSKAKKNYNKINSSVKFKPTWLNSTAKGTLTQVLPAGILAALGIKKLTSRKKNG